ncbi:MAG: hypothetical protein NXH72_11265 [Hyphomonadaceae bacterium]|nr:hypothetical protein [Hyphomonadaceae bacterium]
MRILALSTVLLALSACQSGSRIGDAFDTRQNLGTCPPAGAVYNASRIVDFEGEEKVFGNVEYTGEIVGVRLYCRYAGTDPVRAEVEIDFAFGKGPAATGNRHDYGYWIAVTRRSGKVLQKQHFTVSADFSDGPVTGESELIQRILIPRADESVSAANFEVLVGFDLTEDQLTYNREGRRFRLNAGQ